MNENHNDLKKNNENFIKNDMDTNDENNYKKKEENIVQSENINAIR